ncbi:AMP-binding protein [Patescibacteria group bacterium]|nr:AMP-binding protein [Patescibacteria group bacterium]
MYKDFTHFLKDLTDRFDDKTALYIRRIFKIERITYRQLHENVKKLGIFFKNSDVKAGDRVLIWGPNIPEWVVALLGCFYHGVIVVPVNVHTSQATFEKYFAETEAKLIFISKSIPKLPEQYKEKIFYLEDLLNIIRDLDEQESFDQNEDEVIEIVYTSGTTGEPKGLMITHRNIFSELDSLWDIAPRDPDYRLLSLLPLSHVMEQVIGLILPLSLGGTIYYLPKINTVTISKALNKYKISYLGVVPQMLRILLDSIENEVEKQGIEKEFKKMLEISERLPFFLRKYIFRKVHRKFGGHLKMMMCGSAPLPPKLGQTWENMGFKVIEGYGASETSAAATCNTVNKRVFGTVGKPMRCNDVKIIEDGEVVIKGSNVTPGYFKNPEKTKESFTEDGYFKTGDIGYFDENGYLRLSGRTKFRIVTPAGEKVYPEDLEVKLNSHGDIWDNCVIGIPVEGGEEVYAVVITKEGANLDKVIEEVNNNLEAHQKIRQYSKWEEKDFPRLHTLKVDRKAVKERILENKPQTPENIPNKKADNDNELKDIISLVCKVNPAEIGKNKVLTKDFHLDSLRRVALVSLIEEEYGVIVEESDITQDTTVSDLEKLIKIGKKRVDFTLPAEWPLNPFLFKIRDFLRNLIVTPIQNYYITDLKVEGIENLKGLKPPLIIVFNHIGHYDHALIYRILPKELRLKLTGLADKELYRTKFKAFLQYFFGGAYPVDKYGGPVRKSLELATDLLDRGFVLLLSPEGEISYSEKMLEFKKGVGMLAVETGVPVLPIRIKGYHKIYKKRHEWPFLPPDGRGEVTVVIGKSRTFEKGTTYDKSTKIIRDILEEL